MPGLFVCAARALAAFFAAGPGLFALRAARAQHSFEQLAGHGIEHCLFSGQPAHGLHHSGAAASILGLIVHV